MARPGLRNHPKFLRLVHLTGEPEPHVFGHLGFLWEVAYECGNDEIGDQTDVELAAKWDGEPGKLFDALLTCGGQEKCGFIEARDNGRYAIHDLWDHAPDYVINRSKREAERRAKGVTLKELRSEAGRKGGIISASKRQANASNLLEGGQANASKRQANAPTPAPAPAPAPSNTPKAPKGATTEFPANLDIPEFHAAWADWLTHRNEIRKPLRPTSQAKLLAKFSQWGACRATAAIAHSIENGWEGCFEPKYNGKPTPKPSGQITARNPTYEELEFVTPNGCTAADFWPDGTPNIDGVWRGRDETKWPRKVWPKIDYDE